MSHLKNLLAALPSEADAILITNKNNQYYLTDFDFDDGMVLVTRGASYLLTDPRYIENAKAQTDPAFTVLLWKGKRSEFFKELLDANGVSVLLFEDNWVTVSQKEGFDKTFDGYTLRPAGSLLEDLREYKDELEIDKIVKAQRIAELALDHILGYITPDKTETEVALELEFYMRAHGAASTSFDTIAVSGAESSKPHGVPRNVKLEKGFFTMDFGARYRGYCSDMTRTVVIGKADAAQKKLYNTVLAAQNAAEDAVREGITGAELDKIARDVIDAVPEFKDKFCHGLGHGVGMYIHESPSNSAGGKKPFTVGHVITIEPGIYIPGYGGVRIEDMVVFRQTGPEVITKARKDLIEI